MIQTLALVAVVVSLGLAVLASGAISARAALARFAAQSMDVALHDSLVRFTSDVRAIVAAQGASGPWPGSQQSDPYPHDPAALQPVCAGTPETKACPFAYTFAWSIAGHTNASVAVAPGGPDTAENLQRAVIDEERVAGSVTVRLLDRHGQLVATRTRFVTLRVFDTAPYAIVSGVRESDTLDGTRTAAQGDTGGTPARAGAGVLADAPSPDPANPDRYRDTRIKVDMDCVEQSPSFDENNPYADNSTAGDDGLPWGVSGSAFEVPCNPGYANQITQNAPPGKEYPTNPFPLDAFAQASWATGDNSNGAWSP